VAAVRGDICASGALREKGPGVRFEVEVGGHRRAAFAVRYEGRVYAYFNRCTHRGLELDWQEGDFFDSDAQFLFCATHGARYHPASGACAGGPCAGGLEALAIEEADGRVRLATDDATLIG